MLIREFPNKPWNHLRTLQTTMGLFLSVYYPGPVEEVEIAGPTGARLRVKTPQLVDWALHAIDGKLAVAYSSGLGDTKQVWLEQTSAICGQPAAEGRSGPAPAPIPTGGGMADAQFQELKIILANIAQGTDRMWTDVVGRLKAHDAQMGENLLALDRTIDALPQQVLLHPAAADGWGLDERARSGAMLQDMIMVLLSDQAKMQVFLQALFEAARNLKAEGIDLLAPPQE